MDEFAQAGLLLMHARSFDYHQAVVNIQTDFVTRLSESIIIELCFVIKTATLKIIRYKKRKKTREKIYKQGEKLHSSTHCLTLLYRKSKIETIIILLCKLYTLTLPLNKQLKKYVMNKGNFFTITLPSDCGKSMW